MGKKKVNNEPEVKEILFRSTRFLLSINKNEILGQFEETIQLEKNLASLEKQLERIEELFILDEIEALFCEK